MILQTLTLAAFSPGLQIALGCASLCFHHFRLTWPPRLTSLFFPLLLPLSLATSTNHSLSVPFRPSHSGKNLSVNNRPDDKRCCDLQNAELTERGKERSRAGEMVKLSTQWRGECYILCLVLWGHNSVNFRRLTCYLWVDSGTAALIVRDEQTSKVM